MRKSLIALLLAAVTLCLLGCSSGLSGLKSYANTAKGYEFLYPNGWIQVDVRGASPGVDAVFHDLVERSENLSVIVSDVPAGKTLEALGTPTEVGDRFWKGIANDPESGRQAEFLNAEAQEHQGKTYYLLEYQVKLPDGQERHNLATVAVSRGKLFTFNLSTREGRWSKVKDRFEVVAQSFTVY